MKRSYAAVGLVILLAGYLAGCGRNKGGGEAAVESAGVRTAASIPNSNVSKLGTLVGGIMTEVFVSGNYAYTVMTPTGAPTVGGGLLSIQNISSATAPVQTGSVYLPGVPYGVFVAGSYAFVADGTSGLIIVNVSNPTNPTIVGSYYAGGDYRSVVVSYNFAIVAAYDGGLKIINITNPASPSLIGSVALPGGNALAVAVKDNYAYVAADTGGLKVVSFATPSNPTVAANFATAGSARNIFVSGSSLYVAEGGSGTSGFEIVDISIPNAPALLGSAVTAGPANDVYVSTPVGKGPFVYITQLGSGLRVYDASNAASPTEVGSYSTSAAAGVVVSGNYTYLAENTRGLTILNSSNEANLTEAGKFEAPNDVRDVDVAGNYAYVADGNYGVRAVNVTNPSSPAVAGGFKVSPSADFYHVVKSGNYAYTVNRMPNGVLNIVDVTNPASPALAGSIALSFTTTNDLAVSGNYAYVTDGMSGLKIVNVSNPASPTLAGSYAGQFSGVSVSGNYAYVLTAGTANLSVLDISNPASPTLVGSYNASPGAADTLTVSGNYAYIANGANGLLIINVSNPASPTLAGSYDTSGSAYEVKVSGVYAYVADGDSGLLVLNVNNPATPLLAGSFDTQYTAIGVSVLNGRAYVADGAGGLRIFNFNSAAFNPAPAVTSCAFTPYSLPAGGTASSTLQCNVTDANSNLSSVTVDLSCIGGSAATPLTNTSGSTWRLTSIIPPATATVRTNYPVITATDALGGVGSSQATLAVTAYVAPANPKPVVSGCAFSPSSIMAGGATSTTVTCTVTDANNNLSGVSVNLSSIGIAEPMSLSNIGGSTWRLSEINAPVGATVRMNYPLITATDAQGATGTSQATLNVTANINPKPVVSGCAFTPNRIYAGVPTNTTTLQCTVTDANNNLSTVTANLLSMAGSTTTPLTNMGGGVWRATNLTAGAGAIIGTRYPVITATDALNATGTSQATIITVNPAPSVTNCAFSPNNIKANSIATTTLNCTITDANNNLGTPITVDLTSISLGAAVPLTDMGGGNWRLTGIMPFPATPAGNKYPVTTASDTMGATKSQAATLTILP